MAAAGDPDAWAAFRQRFLEVDESGYQMAVGQADVERKAQRAAVRAGTTEGGTR